MLERLYREIVGDKCSLVPLTTAYTDLIIRWRNDQLNAQWFLSQKLLDPASHESWLERARLSGIDFNWIIVSGKNKPLGTIGAYKIDVVRSEAEFGRLLIGSSDERGRGIASYATRLCLSALRECGLERSYLFVKNSNTTAVGLYKRIGFKTLEERQGILRMEINLSNMLN